MLNKQFGQLVVESFDGYLLEDRQKQDPIWLCKCLCGCGTSVRSSEFLLVQGKTVNCTTSIEPTVTYDSMHEYMRSVYGKASEYMCQERGCKSSAKEWSYVNNCLDEKEELDKSGLMVVRFCSHAEHYSPRCVKHHRQYDFQNVMVKRTGPKAQPSLIRLRIY